jgi:hypothetical protein
MGPYEILALVDAGGMSEVIPRLRSSDGARIGHQGLRRAPVRARGPRRHRAFSRLRLARLRFSRGSPSLYRIVQFPASGPSGSACSARAISPASSVARNSPRLAPSWRARILPLTGSVPASPASWPLSWGHCGKIQNTYMWTAPHRIRLRPGRNRKCL